VAKLTPDQQRKRERVEAVIGVMAPALTVLLAAGDRISRIVQPEDHEYYPARNVEASPQGGATDRLPAKPA